MTAGTGTITLGVAMATSTTFFALGASSIISAEISFAASFTSSTTATAPATTEGSETAADSLDSVVISLDSVFVFDEFFAHVTFLSYKDSKALA